MNSSPEVEAKLALPGPVYWRLRDDPDLLGLAVVGRAFERQTNLFYDSPDGALRRAGAALRARRIAGRPGVEWTMKSGRRLAAGIQTADEVIAWGPYAEDPLAAAEGLAPVAAAQQLADATLQGGSLRMDAASLVDRLLLEVAAPSGGEIEVALDRLRILGDPAFVDYELEAEAHGTARSDVEALARELISRFDLEPSTDSKRARIQEYADGRLGPPRVGESDPPAQLAGPASMRASGHDVRLLVEGLTGSPRVAIALSGDGAVESYGLNAVVSTPPVGGASVDLRIWVAASVHWRLLRHLVPRLGDAASALEDFRLRTEAVDRRALEWRWREADLVVFADQPAVLSEQRPVSSAGRGYRPDDLPLPVGGKVVLQSTDCGSRLTFAADAWPADLADLPRVFDTAVQVEQVAEALTEIGYERTAAPLPIPRLATPRAAPGRGSGSQPRS